MKKITVLVAEKELVLNHASSVPSGYGHIIITVELYYNGEYKKFTATTNNMPDYDKATELEGNDRYHAFYKLIERLIIDEVAEWLEDKEININH